VRSFSCSLRIRDAESAAGVLAAAGKEKAAGTEVGLDLVWWLLLSVIVYLYTTQVYELNRHTLN